METPSPTWMFHFCESSWGQISGAIKPVAEIANAGGKGNFEEVGDTGPWHDLVEIYEKVLRETCPKERSARYDRER